MLRGLNAKVRESREEGRRVMGRTDVDAETANFVRFVQQ